MHSDRRWACAVSETVLQSASTSSCITGQSHLILTLFEWPVPARFFFWFEIHTASTPITAGTHTDGGAVRRKPGSAWLEGTRAISVSFVFCFMIVVLKQTFAYADMKTNDEKNKTHMNNNSLILKWNKFDV